MEPKCLIPFINLLFMDDDEDEEEEDVLEHHWPFDLKHCCVKTTLNDLKDNHKGYSKKLKILVVLKSITEFYQNCPYWPHHDD